MKRTISLLSILAFVLAFSASVFAQNVTASANILTQLTYSVDQNLNFGNLESDFGSATLSPTGTGGDSGLNENFQAGRITISGDGSQTVNVSLDNTSVVLTHGTSTDVLTLTPSISGAGGNTDAARGGGTSSASDVDVTLSSGAGESWLGGSLSSTDNDGGGIASGLYENTTDLSVTLDYTFGS